MISIIITIPNCGQGEFDLNMDLFTSKLESPSLSAVNKNINS